MTEYAYSADLPRLTPGMLLKLCYNRRGPLYDQNAKTFLREGEILMITKVPDYDHPEIQKGLKHLNHEAIALQAGRVVLLMSRADFILSNAEVLAESP